MLGPRSDFIPVMLYEFLIAPECAVEN